MRSRFAAAALLALFALAVRGARAAEDASVGYATIRPSVVKVWAFDRSGRPTESGTGLVVDSSDRRSLILTATHVIDGAASIHIDVSRDLHDVVARVERTGPRDLTLLSVERGGLRAAHFAPRSHPVVAGNLVAVAGYVKNDELIGVVGQEPRVLFPGTVSSRPENGTYLELENVHIEEGLSGGAVFDPATGDVLGIVIARTTDRRGGFADSAALVVEPFLDAYALVAANPPVPRPPAAALPQPSAPPAPALPVVPAPPPLAVAALATLGDLRLPPPAPAGDTGLADGLAGDGVSWHGSDAQPEQFLYTHDGCRIAVTIDVKSLQFELAHHALAESHGRDALLGITLQQRAAASDACADVGDTDPVSATYDPTAMSYDGHRVTIRLAYAGDPDASDWFPSDASLDADLDGDPVTATLQFFADGWSGSIALPLVRSAPASVSRTP